jgi:type II secretory pathway component PulK
VSAATDRSPPPPRLRRAERGSVLLAVVLLMTATVAMSASLIERASSVALELHSRRNVLCARYAALGGLALGTTTGDPTAAAALVSDDVDSLIVSRLRLGPAWCVRRATASCGRATRTLDVAEADSSICNAAPP